MELDWDRVLERYRGGRAVAPLAGQSQLRVSSSDGDGGDPDAIVVTQRLWRARVTRAELEVALALLADRPAATPAIAFSEELRRYYSGGSQVQPTCSRTPNLCAVILADLGLLSR